jgi:serine/threonine protein kinase
MDLIFLRPHGPQPAEMEGLAELKRGLPARWKAYANFIMRQPGRRGQDREIDVVMITDDRLVLIDLKHWSGRIENRGGYWHRNGERREASPAQKIREHAKALATLLRNEVQELRTVPPVESVVVFTHPKVDITGLEKSDLERSLKLVEFLDIANDKKFKTLFTTRSVFDVTDSLCGKHVAAFRKFFSNGRFFEPRKAVFHGFVPIDFPELEHGKLFVEYACRGASDPNYTGLLRLWDFGDAGDELCVEEARRPVAERERVVLGHLRMQDPVFHDQFVLRSLAHDDEYTLRYSEVFDRHPDLVRFGRFQGALARLDGPRRTELAQFLLDRVASLHRSQVAHRDLDRHSVWIDEHRSRVVLSGLGAAHFPERQTLGENRAKLMVAGHRTPEDVGVGQPGSAFQQDVFLAAALIWTLLTGEGIPIVDGTALWTPSLVRPEQALTDDVVRWLERCLSLDAVDRYRDGVEAAERFYIAISKAKPLPLEGQLARFQRDIDPLSDLEPTIWIKRKPHRVYRARAGADEILVKSWPETYIGERRKSATRLFEFFARAEKIIALGIVPWAPRHRQVALCTDGLLLVQDWVDGRSLSEGLQEPEAKQRNYLKELVLSLVAAVDELHEAGLAHGDLSPKNILVTTTEDGPQAVLVDLVDYANASEGERKTLAYCPPETSDADPKTRDRYAVCAIAGDLIGKLGVDFETERWLEAIKACGEGELPWRSLRAIRAALTDKQPRPTEFPLSRLSVGLPRPPFQGDLLPDDGVFHLIVDRSARRLEIVGFDQKVTIKLDAGSMTPFSAEIHRVDARSSSWAMSHRTATFDGVMNVYQSPRTQFGGFVELLARADIESLFNTTAPIAAGSADEEATKIREPHSSLEHHTPPPPSVDRFPVVKFWEETIKIEEEIRPEIMLAELPKRGQEPGSIAMVGEQPLSDLEMTEGQSVNVIWNGVKIGDLDIARSGGVQVIVRNARRCRGLGAGDILKFQSAEDWISFERRTKAVRRILQQRSQIPDLIAYFDPTARLEPRVLSDQIADGVLDAYKLNLEQEEAFRHLWVHGPVGLLQGPPGTGKTRFIAAFAHYALTRGRLRNVLVLSQSHEAVNTAAEGIQEMSQSLGGSIDFLRVGQQVKFRRRYANSTLRPSKTDIANSSVLKPKSVSPCLRVISALMPSMCAGSPRSKRVLEPSYARSKRASATSLNQTIVKSLKPRGRAYFLLKCRLNDVSSTSRARTVSIRLRA